MANFKLILAYDGTELFGWQKSEEGRSVEGSLETALQTLYQTTPKLQAASRTDRGVHAEGQVVNFHPPSERYSVEHLCYTLNRILPDDIRVLRGEQVAETFHPTLDAKRKEYHYHISLGNFQSPHERRTAWHHPQSLDLKSMRKACSYLIGNQDFKALRNVSADREEKETIRTVHSTEIEERRGGLLIRIQADRFLYRMARNMVGLLVAVGRKKISPQQVKEVLASQDRTESGMTAPAKGLTLYKVSYS